MEEKYASFIIAKKPNLILTYNVSAFKEELCPGMFCQLTVRNHVHIAMLIEFISKPSSDFKYISIESVITEIKALPKPVLALLHWASDYYLYPTSFFGSLLAPGPIWNPSKLERRKKLENLKKEYAIKLKIFGV